MRKSVFILVCFLLLASLTYGQLTLVPINKTAEGKQSSTARTESNTLTLPFWDDFSFTPGQVPIDTLWENSAGVFIGDGIAKNPPSIGVASLDGVNAEGNGYTGGNTGPTDALTSCPIDLSSLNVSDNVFLSFYYQFGGNGEAPEDADSLRVEMLFKENDTTEIWLPVWPDGDDLNRTGDFSQVLVRLDSNQFFFDQFQFRFQNFGRPRGFFDVWNIDYVYLNSGRSASDNNYPDRTIGEPLTTIFDGFTAIPARHFTTNQTTIPSYVVTSVDNPTDDRQPYDNFYSTTVVSWKDSVRSEVNSGDIFRDTESLRAPTRVTEPVEGLFNNLEIPEDQDSVFITINTFIAATDNVLPPTGDYDERFAPIDFRSNDSIQSEFILKDYYAYDDGEAEVAAGLNFAGNQLAIKYPITPEVNDTLVAVDMYFPLTETEPSGRSVNFRIWDVDGDLPGDVLYNEDIFLIRDTLPNTFIRYKLRSPIPLADTFFIGYRQNNEGVLGVGFDIQNNSIDNVFYNIGDQWQEPSDFLEGSFMIRPVFGNTMPDEITSTTEELNAIIKPYPNPTSGHVTFEGRVKVVSVHDMFGRKLIMNPIYEDNKVFINLESESAGIYIINIMVEGMPKTFKIIKR